jgi:NADH-quinone oxidoreductase subunit K
MMIPFGHALAFAAALFVLGLTCVLLRRQVIMILVGVEIMLNAASLVFVAASAYWQQADGQVFVIMLMAITAAEVAVALAMVVYLWRRKRSLVAVVFKGLRG